MGVYAMISAKMLRWLVVLMAAAAAFGQEPVYLVLLKGGNALAYYTRAGQLLAKVPTGAHPHEMAWSADGRVLYTVDNGTMRIEQPGSGGNSLSIIDVAARRKIGDMPLGEFRRPHGIALDRQSGRLYVSTELPDQLLAVDPVKRSVLRRYDPKCKTAHMVTLGPGGKFAYVSCSGSAQVSAVNLDTGAATLIGTGARPEGSVLSKDGRELYVATREAAGIDVISTATNKRVAHIVTGKGPVRIALTPDGRTLVYALMHEKKVAWADPAARTQTDYVLLPFSPVSLTLSPDGRLAFASAEEQGTVYIIDLAVKRIAGTIQTEPGDHPDPVFVYSAR